MPDLVYSYYTKHLMHNLLQIAGLFLDIVGFTTLFFYAPEKLPNPVGERGLLGVEEYEIADSDELIYAVDSTQMDA